ncbi:high mobility group B protein 3 isoform X1 [Ziziphus jujuba]|nr:high mobility group B protein 3 isoform X1 [Ziziphus jujuba]
MKGGKSKGGIKKSTDTRLKSKSAAGVGKKVTKKAGKDPNKPKRPASAFFVFMEEFREKYKKEHPNNKSVAAVGKAGGDKWKSLSEAEKAPFVARAEKRKTEYNKNMQAYNKRLAEGPGADEEESDKSKSEVNDEDDEEDESGEEEDDDE